MSNNKFGEIVETEWLKTEELREYVLLDEYAIMPNHFHGIIGILKKHTNGKISQVLNSKPGCPIFRLKPNSLGSIMGQFKAVVTKRIIKTGLSNFRWQRNYYEHIIRDEQDLNRIRKYIIENLSRWKEDKFFK